MRNVFGNARPPWMMKQPIISHGIIYKKSVNLKIIFSGFIRKSSPPFYIDPRYEFSSTRRYTCSRWLHLLCLGHIILFDLTTVYAGGSFSFAYSFRTLSAIANPKVMTRKCWLCESPLLCAYNIPFCWCDAEGSPLLKWVFWLRDDERDNRAVMKRERCCCCSSWCWGRDEGRSAGASDCACWGRESHTGFPFVFPGRSSSPTALHIDCGGRAGIELSNLLWCENCSEPSDRTRAASSFSFYRRGKPIFEWSLVLCEDRDQ